MLSNKALVVSGAFVGCSGIILTIVMCNAMNRSIANVLIGGFGEGSGGAKKVAKKAEGSVTQVTAEDVVDILTSSKSVIIVPGYESPIVFISVCVRLIAFSLLCSRYGMAVAKAQHAVAALTTRLRRRGIKCRFAIHPVAGRMPGHMNVLLAEASVPYDLIFSMDDINRDFSTTDSVLILGANDIVNPSAQTDPDSPIAGMPVLEVWKARRTVTMKRSLATGYAGVDNPLFINENNAMYLGDARKSVERLVELLGDVDDAVVEAAKKDIETPAAKKAKAVDEFVALMPQLQKDAFLRVGVLRECDPNEAKVAVVPDGCKRLLKKGIQVYVEADAGLQGDFYNEDYTANGAIVLNAAQEVCTLADIIVKIREPTVNPATGKHEIDMIGSSKSLISFLGPRTDDGKALMAKGVEVGVNLLAVDAIPRISRAQSLDVLSSQAKVSHSFLTAMTKTFYE
jgi:NAD(P) transhydrogenase